MRHIHPGGCACGAVRYELAGALDGVVYCHCSQCRRQSGHFVAATRVPDDALTILRGGEEVTWFASSPGVRRGFCRRCGSGLFYKSAERDTISVWAGTLDSPAGLVEREHICAADRGDYYAIADGLPQKPGC